MLVLIGGCRRKAGNRYSIMWQVIHKTVYHLLYLVSSFPLKCSVYSLVLGSETANGCLCIVSRKGFLSGRNFGELLANCIKIKIKDIHDLQKSHWCQRCLAHPGLCACSSSSGSECRCCTSSVQQQLEFWSEWTAELGHPPLRLLRSVWINLHLAAILPPVLLLLRKRAR